MLFYSVKNVFVYKDKKGVTAANLPLHNTT